MTSSDRPNALSEPAAFDAFYKGDMKAKFEELASQRAATKIAANKRVYWAVGIAAFVTLVLIFAIATGKSSSAEIFVIPIIIAAIGFELKRQYLKTFGGKVKKAILPAILNHYGDFAIGSGKDYKSIIIDNITPILPRHNRLTVDDVIVGTYRNAEIVFAEAVAKQKRDKSDTTVFEGIIIEARHPTGLTGIFNLTWQALDWEFPDLLNFGTKGERIRLESPDFEKNFNFYGHDQIEGRTLMTPRLMDAWTALEAHTNRFGLAAQFGPDFVRIKMGRRGDWIDDTILDNARSVEDTMRAIIEDLDAMLAIVDLACFGETDT